MADLFSALQLGNIPLRNRVVMAPLTRNRAYGNRPNDLHVEYYRQRASAGLIVSEGAPIAPHAHGYLDTPGIYNPRQIAAWRAVTDAVHQAGGRIVCQLWHVGRLSHSSLLPDGQAPVAPTCQPAYGGRVVTRRGFTPTTPPRALTDAEIPQIVDQFAQAARCARQAGFDGVEIHAANTYLLDQFMRDSVNTRPAPYGGSVRGRIRLTIEVAEAVAQAIGAGRTGIRFSPLATFRGTTAPDSQPQVLYSAVLDALAPLGLAYIHMIEGDTSMTRQPAHAPAIDYAALRRRIPHSAWIVNNLYERDMAMRTIRSGAADAIAFGRPFISNPDLVERLRAHWPLAPADTSTFYGGGAAGYTDYPSYCASTPT